GPWHGLRSEVARRRGEDCGRDEEPQPFPYDRDVSFELDFGHALRQPFQSSRQRTGLEDRGEVRVLVHAMLRSKNSTFWGAVIRLLGEMRLSWCPGFPRRDSDARIRRFATIRAASGSCRSHPAVRCGREARLAAAGLWLAPLR